MSEMKDPKRENLTVGSHNEEEGYESVDDALDNLFGFDGGGEGDGDAIPLNEPSPADQQFSQELDDATHDEVKELFERIFLQYLHPIQSFIDNLSKGYVYRKVVQSFSSTLDPLLDATGQLGFKDMRHVLIDLKALVEELNEDLPNPVPYKIIRPFAVEYDKLINLLSPSVREEYFADVKYEKDSNPLLEEFRNIRMVGPKRLQRLYAAGLQTIETVEAARADDIAVTTGIPLRLCRELKEVARLFRLRKEREQIQRIKRISEELGDMVRGLKFDRNLRVVKQVAPAIEDLKSTLIEEAQNWERRLLLAASQKRRLD